MNKRTIGWILLAGAVAAFIGWRLAEHQIRDWADWHFNSVAPAEAPPQTTPPDWNRIVKLDVDRQPVSDALTKLADEHEVKLDLTALSNPETHPVTAFAPAIRLRTAADLLLNCVPGDYGTVVDGDKLVVVDRTARNANPANYVTRLHVLTPLLTGPHDFDEHVLAAAIRTLFAGGSWSDRPDPNGATLEAVPGGLIVCHVPEVHEQIDRLIHVLATRGERGRSEWIWPPETDGDRRVREVLNQTCDVEFRDTPLVEFARAVSQRFDLPVGLGQSQTQVTASLPRGARIRAFAEFVAVGVNYFTSFSGFDFEPAIRRDSLVITLNRTPPAWGPRKPQAIRAWPIHDLPAVSGERLMEPITYIGAAATIVGGWLIVTASENAHARVDDLLDQIRQLVLGGESNSSAGEMSPDHRVEQLLRKRVTVNWQDVTLEDAIRDIADRAGVPLFLAGASRAILEQRISQSFVDQPAGDVMGDLSADWGLPHEVTGGVLRVGFIAGWNMHWRVCQAPFPPPLAVKQPLGHNLYLVKGTYDFQQLQQRSLDAALALLNDAVHDEPIDLGRFPSPFGGARSFARIYPVRDLVRGRFPSREEELVEGIRVSCDTFRVEPTPGGVVVVGREHAHRDVERLLALLRGRPIDAPASHPDLLERLNRPVQLRVDPDEAFVAALDGREPAVASRVVKGPVNAIVGRLAHPTAVVWDDATVKRAALHTRLDATELTRREAIDKLLSALDLKIAAGPDMLLVTDKDHPGDQPYVRTLELPRLFAAFERIDGGRRRLQTLHPSWLDGLSELDNLCHVVNALARGGRTARFGGRMIAHGRKTWHDRLDLLLDELRAVVLNGTPAAEGDGNLVLRTWQFPFPANTWLTEDQVRTAIEWAVHPRLSAARALGIADENTMPPNGLINIGDTWFSRQTSEDHARIERLVAMLSGDHPLALAKGPPPKWQLFAADPFGPPPGSTNGWTEMRMEPWELEFALGLHHTGLRTPDGIWDILVDELSKLDPERNEDDQRRACLYCFALTSSTIAPEAKLISQLDEWLTAELDPIQRACYLGAAWVTDNSAELFERTLSHASRIECIKLLIALDAMNEVLDLSASKAVLSGIRKHLKAGDPASNHLLLAAAVPEWDGVPEDVYYSSEDAAKEFREIVAEIEKDESP